MQICLDLVRRGRIAAALGSHPKRANEGALSNIVLISLIILLHHLSEHDGAVCWQPSRSSRINCFQQTKELIVGR